jgi:hypothetical protein
MKIMLMIDHSNESTIAPTGKDSWPSFVVRLGWVTDRRGEASALATADPMGLYRSGLEYEQKATRLSCELLDRASFRGVCYVGP